METWTKGPDTLFPATSSISTKLDEAVTIRFDPELYEQKPISIYSWFKEMVDRLPNQYALGKP